eukprot:3007123-Amphidinium_carterae.1
MLRKQLRQEAHHHGIIDTLVSMVASNRSLVERYLTGSFTAEDEKLEREAAEAKSKSKVEGAVAEFNLRQRQLKSEIEKEIARANAAWEATTEEESDRIRQDAFENNKIHVCFGPPGSGKTTVAMAVVNNVVDSGGAVLFAYPTNMQASRMHE